MRYKLEEETGWYGSLQNSTGVECAGISQPGENNRKVNIVKKSEKEGVKKEMGKRKEAEGSLGRRIGKGGGGERMKRIIIAVALIAVMSGIGLAISPDSVQLYVSPAFSMSVNISSTTNQFAGGNAVNLGESRTLCVGWVCNDGNVSSRWQKQTANSGNWTLVTDGATGFNQFRLLAITTGTATLPGTSAVFSEAANTCLGGSTTAIVTAGYTDLAEGGLISPTHAPFNVALTTRSLWVSIMMPSDVTDSVAKTITLSIQAVTP